MHVPAQTGETILVCDDDLTVLEFLCDALKGAGYHVVAVHDGRSVLPALEANSSIRLLVVDFAMPEMNGAAVIRQVLSTSTGPADPADHRQYRTRCGPGRDPNRAHIVQAVPPGATGRARWTSCCGERLWRLSPSALHSATPASAQSSPTVSLRGTQRRSNLGHAVRANVERHCRVANAPKSNSFLALLSPSWPGLLSRPSVVAFC